MRKKPNPVDNVYVDVYSEFLIIFLCAHCHCCLRVWLSIVLFRRFGDATATNLLTYLLTPALADIHARELGPTALGRRRLCRGTCHLRCIAHW